MCDLRPYFSSRDATGRTYVRPNLTELDINPEPHVAGPSGGLTIDAEARTAINGLRDLLVAHGLMEANGG